MYLGLNAVLRASGHPQKAMYATINTVIINTILAPIFIYGFDWGIRGAAIATVIAQIVSLIWQFKILTNKMNCCTYAEASTIYKARLCET